MSKNKASSWLVEHAAQLPHTVGRVLDRTVAEPARQARTSVADATPFADGVEARLRQADAAIERAKELEAKAAEKAVRAREASDEAQAVPGERLGRRPPHSRGRRTARRAGGDRGTEGGRRVRRGQASASP